MPLRTDTLTADAIAAMLRRSSTGDALHRGAGRHAGRLRPVPGAAAAARARLDARARARRRRAAEQRAHGHRSRGRRSRPGRRRRRSRRSRCSAAPARCSTAPTRSSGTINIITNRPRFSTDAQFDVRLRRLLQLERERPARHGHARRLRPPRGRSASSAAREHFDDYTRRQGLRRELAAVLRRRHDRRRPTRSTTNFGFTFHAFPDPFNAPFTRTSRRDSRVRAWTARRSTSPAIAQLRRSRSELAGEVPAPPRRRRRLPGLRAAVLLPDDHAAVEQPRQVLGDLRDHRRHAVAARSCRSTSYYQHQDRLLRNDFPVQFPVPSPHVLPDQRVPSRHPERHAPAGLDARRRRAGHLPAAAQQRADRRPHDLPRSQRGRRAPRPRRCR